MSETVVELAYKGDVDAVLKLIDENESCLQDRDEFGHSALMSAVLGRHLELCKILISKGLSVNEQSPDYGFSLLHKACFMDSYDICELLCTTGADVNLLDPKQTDPLYNAIAGTDNVRLCRLLVEHGASKTGALHSACFNGKIRIVQWLVEEGVDSEINSPGYLSNTPLHLACQQGHYEVCEYLVNHGAQVSALNDSLCTPLHEAVLSSSAPTKIIELLVQHGADVNAKDIDDRAPLHKAASNGHVEHCRVLLAAPKADINILDQSKCPFDSISPHRGDTALHFAIIAGNIEMCEFLLSNGIKTTFTSSSGKPILAFAFQLKKYKIANLLVEHGADVNAFEIKKMDVPTTLQDKHAVIAQEESNSSGSLTSQMVNWGRRRASTTSTRKSELKVIDQINQVTFESVSYAETALHSAAQSGNMEACVYLISKKADINIANSLFGNTALHIASREGYADICEVLLKSGAQVNTKNKYSDLTVTEQFQADTPLHLAAQHGHWDVCELLMSYGADCTAMNALSKTPLQVVDENIKYALELKYKRSAERRLMRGNQMLNGVSGGRNRLQMQPNARVGSTITTASVPTPSNTTEAVATKVEVKKSTDTERADSDETNSGLGGALTAAETGLAIDGRDPASSSASGGKDDDDTSLMTTPPLRAKVVPFLGFGRTWKQRKVRFSTHKTMFKKTIWEIEPIELHSAPGKGAWLVIKPTTKDGLMRTIDLKGVLPFEVDIPFRQEQADRHHHMNGSSSRDDEGLSLTTAAMLSMNGMLRRESVDKRRQTVLAINMTSLLSSPAVKNSDTFTNYGTNAVGGTDRYAHFNSSLRRRSSVGGTPVESPVPTPFNHQGRNDIYDLRLVFKEPVSSKSGGLRASHSDGQIQEQREQVRRSESGADAAARKPSKDRSVTPVEVEVVSRRGSAGGGSGGRAAAMLNEGEEGEEDMHSAMRAPTIIKLSFGHDRACRNAWKVAIVQHIANGK